MRGSTYLLVVWLYFIQLNETMAQPAGMLKDLRMEHITSDQGLSSNNVFKIMQDQKGFIWIITSAGLNRYDGYSFKFYGYSSKDASSVSPDWFDAVIDNSNGLIWIIGSLNRAVYSFNPSTEKFARYVYQDDNGNTMTGAHLVQDMEIDSRGILWIASYNGLLSFNPQTKKFQLYSHREDDKSTISGNNVNWLEKDTDGNLWLSITKNDMDEVDYFDPQSKKLIAHMTDGSSFLPQNINQLRTYTFNAGRNGNIWISSDSKELYGYNIRSKKSAHFVPDASDPYSINDGCSQVLEDRSGNLWIWTHGNTLSYYDSAAGKFYHSSLLSSALSTNYPANQMFEDRSGKIWIATRDDGIFTFNPDQKQIHLLQSGQGNKNSLPSNIALCILETRSGLLLFSTSKGVSVLNKTTGAVSPIEISENGKNISETLGDVWYMYEDRKGLIWLCSMRGLLSFDPRTRKHRWYRHNDQDTSSLSTLPATGIIQDSKGRYWATTWTGGFNAFDPITGKFRAFKTHSGPNSISSNNVANLIESLKGIIYIGTWDGGFITFNPDKETFKIYRHDPKDSSSVSSDIVFDCYEASNGIIWLCTNGGGINAFDPETEKFKAFTTKEGLCDNGVTSIAADNKGNLWVGTVNGISGFTPPANPFATDCKIIFRNYHVSDGLPANHVNLASAYRGNDGTMYFGTTNSGFFYFHPDALKDNPFIPPVFITGFDLFNRPVNVGDDTKILSMHIEDTKEIKLHYNQDVISFTLAALNYIHPEKNGYAYKLEGFDKDWIYTDASKRFANYTNLDAGEYIFRVKASNNDGLWNEEGSSIKLIIAPPFWQTLWFKLICILAAAAILYAIFYSRMQKLRDIRRIRNKIASDLHDDLGATLSSISIMSALVNQQEKSLSNQSSSLLEKIGNSSRNMIENVNDMVWAINPKNDSFENIIRRMKSFASEILSAKEIAFHFDFDKNLLQSKLKMEMRRDFYLIFKEAVNNLAKYSNAANAFVMIWNKENNLKMTIRDDGNGFDLNSVVRGNGLSNMQQRADEMKARFNVESFPGKGTIIELEFKND